MNKSNIPLSFEDYLIDIHAKDYAGLDDEMSESFEEWLCDLDGEELLEYGEGLYKLLTIS